MVCLLRTAIGDDPPRASSAQPSGGDEHFGVYMIERHPDGSLYELGRGAMGVTYRALDTTLQRKVALKIIRTDGVRRTEARERFMREARAAASLRHENIATIFQFGISGETGQVFYAMELIEGETLEERIRRRGPLDISTTIDIAQQVVAALDDAEKHGLIHRDLKPANLMLISAGGEMANAAGNDEKLAVKIIDFGLAKALNASIDSMRLTQDGFVGTPAFASPEQFEHSAVDVRSDIYSLGATLWFALTGKTPFDGRTPKEIHRAQQSKALPMEQLKAARVPHRARSLLEAMLALEAAARPGIHELASRLQRCSAEANGVRRTRVALAAAIILILSASSFLVFRPLRTHPVVPGSVPAAPGKSIAVLPFENLSEENANAYFAEGIQNEILTKLATVRDLKVISRTSTAKYKSKPENLKEVGQELGVSTVLEGAVQRAGDKVRVNVQLIDARADTHLWAKSYDRDFKDVLEVESEVSEEIAEALQANLLPSESHAISARRTPDTQAYDLFLRGEYEFRQAESHPTSEAAYDRADVFYRQALTRDPNFVEAAAALAQSRLMRHWFVSPLTVAHLDEVKSLIDRALALAPNSPEAHLALGLFFYWGHRQYENALTEFKRTLELQSNNALARLYCALVYRRRGEWERSLADTQRAQELNPRDASIPQSIGVTYTALRLWKDAERAALRALAIDPHYAPAVVILSLARLNGTGDPDSARRAFDDFPEATKGYIGPPTGSGSNGNAFTVLGPLVYIDVIQKRFTDAFQVVDNDSVRLRRLAGRAILRVLAGELEAAKPAAEEALPLLEARLKEQPDDRLAMRELSWVYLALERNADALRISKQAADSLPIEKDALFGPSFQAGLAEIEARTGAPEEAVKRLRSLLSIPAGWGVSIARLKIDPVWDPIRNRPDFQQLLSGPEQIGPNK